MNITCEKYDIVLWNNHVKLDELVRSVNYSADKSESADGPEGIGNPHGSSGSATSPCPFRKRGYLERRTWLYLVIDCKNACVVGVRKPLKGTLCCLNNYSFLFCSILAGAPRNYSDFILYIYLQMIKQKIIII